MPGFPPRGWGRPHVEVFAVEPTAVQLTWVALPSGPVRVRTGEQNLLVDSDGGPGGVVVGPLASGRRHRIDVESTEQAWTLVAHTSEPPPGEELFRFATVSDIHIGLDHFGLSKRMRERTPADPPHPFRCAAAALAEAAAWGAERIVVKGDLVERGRPQEWAAADRLLAATGLPTSLVPGNHEVKPRRLMDPPAPLPRSGVDIVDHVDHLDVAGLRIILVNSTVEGRGRGAVDHLRSDVADLAAGADRPVLVAMHQHPQRFEAPWFWPPGIPGREARRFLTELRDANPRAMVTTGHTHRNRARRHDGLLVTEVGSTKDYPGVWAGYAVHEGGIVQVVRRTLAPEAMRWTEYSRRAVLGLWGRWAHGTLGDRCQTIRW